MVEAPVGSGEAVDCSKKSIHSGKSGLPAVVGGNNGFPVPVNQKEKPVTEVKEGTEGSLNAEKKGTSNTEKEKADGLPHTKKETEGSSSTKEKSLNTDVPPSGKDETRSSTTTGPSEKKKESPPSDKLPLGDGKAILQKDQTVPTPRNTGDGILSSGKVDTKTDNGNKQSTSEGPIVG